MNCAGNIALNRIAEIVDPENIKGDINVYEMKKKAISSTLLVLI